MQPSYNNSEWHIYHPTGASVTNATHYPQTIDHSLTGLIIEFSTYAQNSWNYAIQPCNWIEEWYTCFDKFLIKIQNADQQTLYSIFDKQQNKTQLNIALNPNVDTDNNLFDFVYKRISNTLVSNKFDGEEFLDKILCRNDRISNDSIVDFLEKISRLVIIASPEKIREDFFITDPIKKSFATLMDRIKISLKLEDTNFESIKRQLVDSFPHCIIFDEMKPNTHNSSLGAPVGALSSYNSAQELTLSKMRITQFVNAINAFTVYNNYALKIHCFYNLLNEFNELTLDDVVYFSSVCGSDLDKFVRMITRLNDVEYPLLPRVLLLILLVDTCAECQSLLLLNKLFYKNEVFDKSLVVCFF